MLPDINTFDRAWTLARRPGLAEDDSSIVTGPSDELRQGGHLEDVVHHGYELGPVGRVHNRNVHEVPQAAGDDHREVRQV